MHVWATAVTPVVQEGVFASALWQQDALSRGNVRRSGTLPFGHAACAFGVGIPLASCHSPSWSIVSGVDGAWRAGVPLPEVFGVDDVGASASASTPVFREFQPFPLCAAAARVAPPSLVALTTLVSDVGVTDGLTCGASRAEIFAQVFGPQADAGRAGRASPSVVTMTHAFSSMMHGAAVNVDAHAPTTAGAEGEDDDWHARLDDDIGSVLSVGVSGASRGAPSHGGVAVSGHGTSRLAHRRAARRKSMMTGLRDSVEYSLLT